MGKLKELTQDELKRNLHYNPDTGIFTWKVSNTNNVKVGDITGCKNLQGYILIGLNNKRYLDHIDRDKSNNKCNNLRHVSRNCNISKRNKSGVTGVTWVKRDKRWYSQIQVNNKTIRLGCFKKEDFDKAVLARWKAEVKYNYKDCKSDSTAYLYLKERNLI